jgi:hypothetical protein
MEIVGYINLLLVKLHENGVKRSSFQCDRSNAQRMQSSFRG